MVTAAGQIKKSNSSQKNILISVMSLLKIQKYFNRESVFLKE
jgi:hypothetical protein